MIDVYKKIVFLTFALTLLFSTALDGQFKASLTHVGSNGSLTSLESQVVALVNRTSAYYFDLELEKIALNSSISNYAFRSGGSAGATAAAMWLKGKFEGFGLETNLESFNFTNWNLLSKPTLIIDEDGDINTTDDQTMIDSFQSEHYGWATPEGGVFADLVVLPLPVAANFNEIGANSINTTLWSTINTQGKIVLIGREVRWNHAWEENYGNKLSAQPPAAVIYTWWYPWMSFSPPFFSSVGGRPPSSWGPYYWNLKIPVGWVDYEDGLLIRNREITINVSAKVSINSTIESGLHYNVVGKLQGYANPDKFVIISSHYDTVMTTGFVDNGAGTAGVLELARILAEATKEGGYNSQYTILFIAFASEELGLVGSTNYVMQHKAEMKDIIAVVNLDCIGSDNLNVARTDSSESFDLDELILKAAKDLNINTTLTEPGGSDQEVFRNPSWANVGYSQWWRGLNADIGDATPVKSSTMLISYPLLYLDEWNMGNAGWIHTSYDNSTSTQTLNWLEPSSLEEHLKVATLSTIRISPLSPRETQTFSLPWWTWIIAASTLIAAVTVVYFAKIRKPHVKNVVQLT